MPLWQYIGSPARVSPCEFRICGAGVCRDGSCPGRVDGQCPFFGDPNIRRGYDRLFRRGRSP